MIKKLLNLALLFCLILYVPINVVHAVSRISKPWFSTYVADKTALLSDKTEEFSTFLLYMLAEVTQIQRIR